VTKRMRCLLFSCALMLAGCSELPSSTSSEPDASIELINYRGVLLEAEHVDGRLVIEDDILVHRSDLGDDKANREFGSHRDLKWRDNVVFYRFGDLRFENGCLNGLGQPVACNTRLTQEGYEAAIRGAMNDWEAVTRVRFVEDTDRTQADVLDIRGTNNRCASFVGRIGGAQTFEWSDRCSFSVGGTRFFSTHHELGHAMGLWHEHQRDDRASYVIVNDAQVTDTLNYGIIGARVNGYDCDSVMHYGALTSVRDASGNLLCTGMGQRDHLSQGDIAGINVLYPEIAAHTFTFAGTGMQQLCALHGREEDANSVFDAWVDGRLVSAPNVFTNFHSEGEHQLRCRVRSCFWRNGYAYPAATVTNSGNTCGSDAEVLDVTETLTVANPGLIAVLFQ
jgi:hypothetical protein